MQEVQAPLPEEAPSGHPRRPRRAFGLLDRLAVVREHWFAAGVVFTLVFGLILFMTLRASPRYEARASLTIESSFGGMTEDLNVALGKPSKVETEMEVLRSFRVATGAARRLMGLEAHPPSEKLAANKKALAKSEAELARSQQTGADGESPGAQSAPPVAEPEVSSTGPRWVKALVQEINAYRPWEVLLRKFTGGDDPLELTIQTDAVFTEDETETYVFKFDADDANLGLTATRLGDDEGEAHVTFAWGEPVSLLGRTFRFDKPAGDLGCRTYNVLVLSPEAYAGRLYGGVKVNPVGRFTDMVEIVCSASTPHEAKARATALAESYLALRQIRKKEEVFINQAWLAKEVLKYRRELIPLEKTLDEFIAEESAGLLSERATSILERQVTLSTKIAGLKRELNLEQWRLERVQAGKGKGVEAIAVLLGPEGSNPMSKELSEKYAELRRERAEMKQKHLLPDTPLVVEKEAEIAAVREELRGLLALALEDKVADQGRVVEGLTAEISTLEKNLDAADDLLEDLPRRQGGLAKHQGAVDRKREVLRRFSEELMRLKSAGAVDDVVASLIDRARLPSSRSSPSLVRMGLLGIFLGLLAGVGLAFLLESLDQKVRTPQQLEEGTGLTIYGSIPAHEKLRKKDRAKLQSRLIALEKPNSIIAEAYRSLRANVRFANKGKRIRCIAVTSALPEEGKTTTVCNLGIVMAQAGSKTLIVDADMRRPSTHVHFGGSRAPGLSDVLRDDSAWQDVTSQTAVDGLEVIYAGRPTGNPGALLDSSAFARLLAELKEAYDYVLFDVPPALAVADSAAFFQGLDGILLLTHYGRCSADVVDGAREQIERVGGNVLGAVLNAFEMNRMARRGYGYYGYGGYYGYYGSHGYYSPDEPGSPGDSEAAPQSGDTQA